MKSADERDITRVSKIFKVLSDETRLKILLFIKIEEKNVTSIAEALNMEQSAVSHQLKLLRDTKVVKTRREGKTILYTLDDAHVLEILTKTFDHVRHS